jgi:hypothetical protein
MANDHKIDEMPTATFAEDASAMGTKDDARDEEVRSDDYDSNDPDFEGMSLYERKSLLIDRDLDRMGMGRYQVCVPVFLPAFGCASRAAFRILCMLERTVSFLDPRMFYSIASCLMTAQFHLVVCNLKNLVVGTNTHSGTSGVSAD